MIRAMKKMCQDMENGTRQVSELNEDLICLISGYCRNSGSGSFDTHKRGAAPFELSVMAALRTVNFILPMCHGRILEKRN